VLRRTGWPSPHPPSRNYGGIKAHGETRHPAAAEEYAEAAFYYSRISPELGGRLYDEMEEPIRDIRGDPERYRLFDTPVRRHFSDVFPYAVLCVNQIDRVWIIGVMRMKRRPGYWRSRLG
jgi:toxin ParE1/3/4